MEEKIDFVITWLDDSDPEWRKEFEFYSAKAGRIVDLSKSRFRSWDNLHFLFRGIEKYAKWVNKIYFVSNANPPKWMNTKHPKLVVLNDRDIVPSQYLPIFSCFPVEFNFHRIEGLSEKFVYFCDDMFLLDEVLPTDFFRNGLPCDLPMMTAISHPYPTVYDNCCFMAKALINSHFEKKKVIRDNFFKWYCLKYPKTLTNLKYIRTPFFPGFDLNHLPQIYLKKTYEEIWKYCRTELERTCASKFRSFGNISPTLIRYWQLASGNFTPCNIYKYGGVFHLSEDNISDSIDCICHQRKKIVCLNDCENVSDFENFKERIIKAFEMTLPNKCSFEL